MSVPIATLLAKRAKLQAQLRAAQDEADAANEDGAMTDEQQTAFDELKAALAKLEAAISNRAAVDALDRTTRGLQIGGGSRDAFTEAARGYRIATALAGACGLHVDDGPEREISRELAKRSGRSVEGFLIPLAAFEVPVERRVLAPTTGGAGLSGVYLDPSGYTDALRAAIVTAKLGARYMTGLDTNIDLPRLSATATAQWVADGAGITTDTTEAFDKISLRPHLLGGIVEFTRSTILTSTPAVQDAVRNDLIQVLARGIDLAAIAGTGGVQPTGIINQPGFTMISPSVNGGPITWPLILQLMAEVQNANAPQTDLAFLSNPSVRAACMGTLKFPGVSGSAPIMDRQDELAGNPFASTTQVANTYTMGTGTGLSTLIYGSFSELLIGVWGDGVEVLVSPYGSTQFASGNVQVRALINADVQLRHTASFAAVIGIAA